MITFYDAQNPSLQSTIDEAGNLVYLDAEDILSYGFQPTTITVTVLPPPTWTMGRIAWSNGSNGVLPVPAPGQEAAYTFSYSIMKVGQSSKSGSGKMNVKHMGGGG